MRGFQRNIIICLLILSLILCGKSTFYCEDTVKAAADKIILQNNNTPLQNPRVTYDKYNVPIATWDCIWFGEYWQNDTNDDGLADRNDKKQPIKWRVLSINGDDVFLLADKCLDYQLYNTSVEGILKVVWEKSTIRSWLNGYGSECNYVGNDYSGENENFIDNAFSQVEQESISTVQVVNNDNEEDTIIVSGGNDTYDKIYLMSLDEMRNSDYGFAGGDTAVAKCTDFAINNGVYAQKSPSIIFKGSSNWWLRSPGTSGIFASYVYMSGAIMSSGRRVDTDDDQYSGNYAVGTRPALHLNLSEIDVLPAGTVSSDGTEDEIPYEIETTSPPSTQTPPPLQEVTKRPDVTEKPDKTEQPNVTKYPIQSETPKPYTTKNPLNMHMPKQSERPVQTPEISQNDQEKAQQFVEDNITDIDGKVIVEVTDLTKDTIVASEEKWNGLEQPYKVAVDNILRDAGSRYVYTKLLELAKKYKIPGFKVRKVMQKNTTAKLKLIHCKNAKVICISSNKKVATINKRGIIKAKKKGHATLIFTMVKGKYTNRVVVNLEVKKKFRNAKELRGGKYSEIKTPTVLIAKKRVLHKSSKIRIFDLQKKSKVKYIPVNKKILTVNRKGKYTGKKRGSTLIRTKVRQNNKNYYLYVYVTIH